MFAQRLDGIGHLKKGIKWDPYTPSDYFIGIISRY